MTTDTFFIFVDLDGVLWDSEAGHRRAFLQTVSNYFPSLPTYFEETGWGFGLPTERVFEEYLKANNLEIKKELVASLTRAKREFAKKFVVESSVLNEKLMLELVDLKRNFDCKVAIVSASSRNNVNGFLNRISQAQIFDAVISRENSEKTKPSPEPYLKALSLLNGKPERSIAIDDSDDGVESAVAAGIGLVIKYQNQCEVLTDIKSFIGVN